MHFKMILKYLLKHFSCFSRGVIHITMYIRQLETEVHNSSIYSAVTYDFHMAESCGNYQSSPYLYLSAEFVTTNLSLFLEQFFSQAFRIPYCSCFPSISLPTLSWSPWLGSSLLDLKMLEFLKPQS